MKIDDIKYFIFAAVYIFFFYRYNTYIIKIKKVYNIELRRSKNGRFGVKQINEMINETTNPVLKNDLFAVLVSYKICKNSTYIAVIYILCKLIFHW
ncbi:MAG: hypothetical protein WCL14_07800 [Bacteroidota bacterium]